MADQDYVINKMVDNIISNPGEWGRLIKDLFELLSTTDQKSREEMIGKLLDAGIYNLPEYEFGTFIQVMASNLADMEEKVRIAFLSSLVKFLESIPDEHEAKARSALDDAIVMMTGKNNIESKKLAKVVLESILLMREKDRSHLLRILMKARFNLSKTELVDFTSTWIYVFISLPKDSKYEIMRSRMHASQGLTDEELRKDIDIIKSTLSGMDASESTSILRMVKTYDDNHRYAQLYEKL